MHQPKQKTSRKANPFILVFVPLFLVIDAISYLMTRPTCLQCSGMDEFIKKTSLTAQAISQVSASFRQPENKS